MPETVTEATQTTTTRYRCALCRKVFHSYGQCARHEWGHHAQDVPRRDEEYYGEDFSFLLFSKEGQVKSFAATFCAVGQRWEGPGWYRRYTYRDSCRGCDMGDAEGLERVDDETAAQWITGEMVARASEARFRFVPPGFGPKFRHHGKRWRTFSVRVPDRAISIHCAAPDGDSTDSKDIIEAWRVWEAGDWDLAIDEDDCEQGWVQGPEPAPSGAGEGESDG